MATWKTLRKRLLFVRLFFYAIKLSWNHIRSSLVSRTRRLFSEHKPSDGVAGESIDVQNSKNIVIIGASFAGYHAALHIARALSVQQGAYRVVVVEPNAHFQFTWVLPRFCVVPKHEHKVFIPYGPYLAGTPPGSVRWVHDRAIELTRTHVRLQDRKESIPYEFCVVATGAGDDAGLPSRVGETSKAAGMERLQDMQSRIAEARRIVVVGGGAAGTELAMDVMCKYPEKEVTLVHSREQVMHRFGPELRECATSWLEKLGVNVITGSRVVSDEILDGAIGLTMGKTIECDFLIRCTGQKPASDLIARLSPNSISKSRHIRVKPTLQVQDDSLPNIYACGDVAEAQGVINYNSRVAMSQAMIVAKNISLGLQGKEPRHVYQAHWAEGVIKLTLGIDHSVTHFGDGKDELLWHSKETDVALMCDGAWKAMGAQPFDDPTEIQ